MNSNIRDFIKAIQNANKTATSAYDTAARVTRVEGGTAWVHVEGGVEETPVEMSISCEPGDDVRVRINKGAAYIIGNNTNPPTNDKAAVQQVINISQIARQTATKAYEYLQSLFDELSKYVAKGTSNIGILSEVMKKTEDGVEIYSDEQSSAVFHTDDGSVELKQRSTTSAEAPAFFHVDLYKKFFGNNNSITGNSSYWSVAEGLANEIKGSGYSHAFGISNKLTGATASIASGNCSNINGGLFNFAFGNGAQIGETDSSGQITASGSHNFAEGLSAKIKSGDYNVAMGNSPSAEGLGNTVFGGNNSVRGSYCYANGWGNTIEGGSYNHAEGQNNWLYGSYNNGGNHIEGRFNKIYGDSSNSDSTHVEGFQNTAYGSQNHIEGSFNTVSNGSNTHVQGMLHTVNGSYNHVGGYGATVRGQYNLIESLSNVNVTGNSNAVTGGNTTVEGSGNNVVNAGDSAKIKGSSNISAGQNQSIEGKYNAVFGYSSRISGNGNLSSGEQNETYGNNSVVGGTSNKVLGNTNFIHGEVNSAYGTKNTIFGSGNIIGSTADETHILFGDGNTKIFYITASNCRSVNSALVDGSSVSGSSYGINGWEFDNPPAKGAVIELNYSAALGNTNTLMVGSGLRINGQGNVVHDELGDGSKTRFTLSNSANSIDEVYKETEYTESGTLSSAEDHIYLDNIINRVFSVLIDGEETTSYVIDSYELSFESELPAGTEWSVVYTSMKTVSSYSFTAGNNYIDLQTAVGDGLVLSVSYDTGIAQTPKLIFGMGNDPKDDTVFEVAWTGSTRKNAFEVTQDGYLRTGVGMAKIAFGKNGNGEYGYWIPATQSEPETFVPWITSPGPTYTAGTNIDITNNVISAPNVAPIVNGKVPEQYLPSYVDDVIEGYYNPTDGKFYEESTYQTEIAGERGKIYISLDTDKSYRWSGTVFVELTSGGVVYSAGSGIDISATNEISADNTIARMTDLSGYLPLAGGTMTGGIDSQNIVPSTDDTYRLGSSASKYNSAYIKRIYNLASIESTTDGSKRLLVPAKSGTIAVNEDLPEVVGNLISVTPILESGTLIANITVSGVSKNLYAPPGGSSYTAGDGIDILNNEISVDDTIARVSAIPDELADLSDDSTHRLVTDTEKSTWNGKQNALTFPLSRANGGTGNTLGQAAQLDVPRDSVNPNTAMTTAPASTVRIDECQPMATGAPEANWFHYITTHSLDTRYGSQLALGMTTNNVYSRIYAGSTWGAWKRLAFADEIPSVSGYLPLAGGAMTGASGIQFPIATGNNKSGNWISAGGGYSTGSGKSGVKIIVCDQSDCISGLGQDCGGGPYELSVIAGAQPGTGTGYIRFLKHVTDSTTYTKLAEIDGDGNFIPQGSIRGNNYTNGYAVNIGCGLDIYPQSSSAGYGGYIDFHYNQSSADYTSRILEKESGLISFDSSVVINPKRRNWGDGIRINCDANGDGFALIAFGGQAGSAGPQANYQEYGIGKWYDGTFIIKDVTDSQAEIMTYSPGTSGGLFLNSKSKIVAHKNLTINSILETWNAGLRINSEPNRADGYAVVTFGGPSGSYTGTNDSYPMYQIGKTRSMGGAFFLNSRISGVERVLMYGHNAGLQFYSFDQTKQVDIQNDGIRTRTNKLYLHGKDNNYSDGSGEPSSPLILDGFESGQITANSSENTNVDIASTGDELVLVFLSAASGNSFYAVRLLRNNNGTLQTINLASNGTSIATISLNANQTNYITIKNTSSSYRLHYKILKLS